MAQETRSSVGDPIWIESILTPEEYKVASKKFLSVFKDGMAPMFLPNYHQGGKWRDRMGKGYTDIEIKSYNKALEDLHKLMKTKSFQRRPDYGTHAEAKP